jgi:hypothetical protein
MRQIPRQTAPSLASGSGLSRTTATSRVPPPRDAGDGFPIVITKFYMLDHNALVDERFMVSQKREDFETITGFPASIGVCSSLGDDKPRLSLLGT